MAPSFCLSSERTELLLVRWERLQEGSAWGEYQELKFKMCNGSQTSGGGPGERCILSGLSVIEVITSYAT